MGVGTRPHGWWSVAAILLLVTISDHDIFLNGEPTGSLESSFRTHAEHMYTCTQSHIKSTYMLAHVHSMQALTRLLPQATTTSATSATSTEGRRCTGDPSGRTTSSRRPTPSSKFRLYMFIQVIALVELWQEEEISCICISH